MPLFFQKLFYYHLIEGKQKYSNLNVQYKGMCREETGDPQGPIRGLDSYRTKTTVELATQKQKQFQNTYQIQMQ